MLKNEDTNQSSANKFEESKIWIETSLTVLGWFQMKSYSLKDKKTIPEVLG